MNKAQIFYIFATLGFFLELFYLPIPITSRSLSQSITGSPSQIVDQLPCKSDDESRISLSSDDFLDDDRGFEALPLFYSISRLVFVSHYAEAVSAFFFFRPMRVHSPLVSSQGPPIFV